MGIPNLVHLSKFLLFFFSFLFSYFFPSNMGVPVTEILFIATKLVGVLCAIFFTVQAFNRRHEQGLRIWTSFWLALPLELFIFSLFDGLIKAALFPADGLLGAFIPYFSILQICRFIVIWMLLAQAAGEHISSLYRSAGLLQ